MQSACKRLKILQAVDFADSIPKAFPIASIEAGINKTLANLQLSYSYAIVTQKCAAWVHNNAVECQYLTQGQSKTTFSKE